MWNEGTCNKVPEKDEENAVLKENDSSVKKEMLRRRIPLVQITDENNVIREYAGDRFLGTQSAKQQQISKSSTNPRKVLTQRSCVSHFMNTESASQISQQPEGNSRPLHQNKELRVPTIEICISNKSDNISSEAVFGQKKNNDLNSHTPCNKKSSKMLCTARR